METRKLYYEDCHLRAFAAQVVGCTEGKKGWQVLLDATAFYPEGGGQACDTGSLGGVRVLDVREQDGQVVHLCDGPLPVGQTVQGVIDWEDRFDRMQQHTGEHILSGLIHARYGYHNVGFHMGKEAVEVDFDGPIPADGIDELERLANEAVWANLPVNCFIPSPEALEQTVYRTKRALPWPVRIVQVPGFDSCACCGVHVARTGEIGIIKVLSCVKFHGGVRLQMLCGRKAYAYLCGIYAQNKIVSQTFSAKLLQTGDAAKQAAEQLAQEKYRAAALEKQVFAATAQGYAGAGNVLHFAEGLSTGSVRELADAIGQVCGGAAAVFSGGSFCLAGDVKALGTALCSACDGRGGGRDGFFQGSVRAERAAIEAFFREIWPTCQ